MASTSPDKATGSLRDLRLRLISGLLLAGGAIALTWASEWSFAALVVAVSMIVAWEWGRIVRDGGIDVSFALSAAAIVTAVGLTLTGQVALGVVAIVVAAIVVGSSAVGPGGAMAAAGVAYAALPALALVWLRSARPLGFEAALMLLLCVWATDTGAYAAGRLIGGPKLAPSVSPNKTWSGLAGGVSASALVATVVAIWLGRVGIGRLAAVGIALAVIAQAGDLMESALKRHHAVKDASNIIPGHGGFMDRVDGLIFAAVAAAAYAALVNIKSPAAALLGWP